MTHRAVRTVEVDGEVPLDSRKQFEQVVEILQPPADLEMLQVLVA